MSSLWETISASGPAAGTFHGRSGSVALKELAAGSILGGELESFRGRSLLLTMREQLSTALALLELDGVARRLVLFLRRPANQSQFSAQLSAQVAEHDALRDVQAYIAEHPEIWNEDIGEE